MESAFGDKIFDLPRIITRGIEKGAKLVAVDPNFSYTANRAQEWIPIRPGTDGAMALAMAHVIIKNDLHDKVFIEEWTVGFDKFSDYVVDEKVRPGQRGLLLFPPRLLNELQ